MNIAKAKIRFDSLAWLILAASLMLLLFLGSKELWTQEWRWADICLGMLIRHDYFHPYLANVAYYDKPLLSYWLMIVTSKLMGSMSTGSLRLPSVIASLITIVCSYSLGKRLLSRTAGYYCAWMLTTTYYFIFWSRVANSDMLNMAGIMLALVWYFQHKEHPSFKNYTVFFLIVAVTSLCKGLLGIVIPGLAVLTDIVLERTWRKHLRWDLLVAFLLSTVIYLLPFWLSLASSTQNHYQQNGLYLVFRENILRFIKPFDHRGPVYTYLIYLPLYSFPWTFFFFPAIYRAKKHWQGLQHGQRWVSLFTLVLFSFFTASGSRRSYYTLPMVPFALLMIADWISSQSDRLQQIIKDLIPIAYLICFLVFNVIQPLYYADGGMYPFARQVQAKASSILPWSHWRIILLDARSKVSFYLMPKQLIHYADLTEEQRKQPNLAWETVWPFLTKLEPKTIYITRLRYTDGLKPFFKDYQMVITHPSLGERLINKLDLDAPVAFIPNRLSVH